jgi:hypothetical protein
MTIEQLRYFMLGAVIIAIVMEYLVYRNYE